MTLEKKRRVLAFTGIKSDYDLMSEIYRAINDSDAFELGLLVSGAHLSASFGSTVDLISQDGFPIIARIESLFDSDSRASRLKSASVLLQCCLSHVEAYKPDLILYAGDREDAVTAALVGTYLSIPTVHFFGGDHSLDGHVDNPVRHATSKLSTYHFVSHADHAKRLRALGESEERIFHIGSPALDKFVRTRWIDKGALLAEVGRCESGSYALVLFHPMPGEEERAGDHFLQVLDALKAEGVDAFIGCPNSDPGGRRILDAIESVSREPCLHFFRNLPRDLFVNLMRHASLMVGNSSAGILEAPSIPLATVNVGRRQVGRLATANVVFVDQDPEEIRSGIRKALSPEFQATLRHVTSPFGDGSSAKTAVQLLGRLDLESLTPKTEDPLQWVRKQ